MGLSEAELAERSGSSVQRVRELKRFGILVQQDDDQFSAKDVHRVRLMQAFQEAGIDLEVIARGISAGKLGYETSSSSFPSRRRSPRPTRRSRAIADGHPRRFGGSSASAVWRKPARRCGFATTTLK